ncbi:ATP-binding protein [Halovenus salina]|uniref:ATP-binding protein n=1 Tax=Halovenus salina TaxID=1510225 RepID=UPI002260B333|nr:ATP-binding protein [Halovenus salina]
MVGYTVFSQAVLLAAGIGLSGLAVRTYRSEKKPVGRAFSALLVLLGATAFCLGITGGTGVPNKLIWLFTNLSIPVALLAFSFNYYGITLLGSRVRAAAALTPAVLGFAGGTLLILGTPSKSPGPEAPLDAVAALPAGVFDAATVFDRIGLYYTAGVVVFAVGLVAVNVLRYEHLDTRLAALIAFIGAWPWLGNFLFPEITPVYGDLAGVSVLSLGYASSALVSGLVVGPLGLFASSPAAGNVGPEHALDSMADCVVITDDHEQVLRLNAVACNTFDVSEEQVVGRSLSAVVGRSPEAVDEAGTTELETVEGVRQFEITRSPVADGNDFQRGTVFVMRDVTQRQTREQRLEVLNRVLRHNLRNNATSIIGRAQLISDGQKTEAAAEQIIETTQNLVGVAESARDIENMMATTRPAETVAVSPIVEEVVSTLSSEAEVTTALPAEATAAVSARPLTLVLSELVENAVEHNDADEPYAVVSADRTEDGALQIAVSDNGPGIPDHERAVLDAGEEDQLQHGSGLGLWAVHWGITQMGGRLAISENDPRGTTVTVTIPTKKQESVTAQSDEFEATA